MEKKDSSEIPWWQPGVILFTRMSGWIAGPIIIAIFLGKYLDEKYNTSPRLFLISVGVAFFISIFGISRDAIKAMKVIEKEEKTEAARKAAEEKTREEIEGQDTRNKKQNTNNFK